MKQTIHDGSRSYSITVPNPEPGKGKHAKTLFQIIRRQQRNKIEKVAKALRKELIMKGE